MLLRAALAQSTRMFAFTCGYEKGSTLAPLISVTICKHRPGGAAAPLPFLPHAALLIIVMLFASRNGTRGRHPPDRSTDWRAARLPSSMRRMAVKASRAGC
jgi:hypothetical protein